MLDANISRLEVGGGGGTVFQRSLADLRRISSLQFEAVVSGRQLASHTLIVDYSSKLDRQ
jgi:hypothetical protein